VRIVSYLQMQIRSAPFRRNAQQIINIHRRSFLGGVFPPSSPYDEPNRNVDQDDLGNGCLLKAGQHFSVGEAGSIPNGDGRVGCPSREKLKLEYCPCLLD
jgi:hypothetical protein